MHLDASERLPAAIHNIGVRSTRALIDLGAISENIRIIRQSLSAGTNLIAVVKANAYGHGALFIARAALAAGASMLGVAAVNEGIVLRRQGVRAPILVLGPADPSQYIAAVENGLTLAVNSTAMAAQINTIANESGRTAHVHLKIDTGMHRYGCNPDDARPSRRRSRRCPNCGWKAFSPTLRPLTNSTSRRRWRRLNDSIRRSTRSRQLACRCRSDHAANSAATIRSRRYDYDAIRLGIAMYGLAPSEDVRPVAGHGAGPQAGQPGRSGLESAGRRA
ncbi:MAG: alanine racemase [Thermomicrobiales bacterium]